jgi:anti-anti-sigma factor
MDIQVESRGPRRVVRLTNKITFEHCSWFQNEIDRILDPDVRELVVDFKNVPFVDSAGIGEILRLFRLMQERNGEIVLINPNSKLSSLFTMYRFDKFMKIRESVPPGEE